MSYSPWTEPEKNSQSARVHEINILHNANLDCQTFQTMLYSDFLDSRILHLKDSEEFFLLADYIECNYMIHKSDLRRAL